MSDGLSRVDRAFAGGRAWAGRRMALDTLDANGLPRKVDGVSVNSWITERGARWLMVRAPGDEIYGVRLAMEAFDEGN